MIRFAFFIFGVLHVEYVVAKTMSRRGKLPEMFKFLVLSVRTFFITGQIGTSSKPRKYGQGRMFENNSRNMGINERGGTFRDSPGR